MRDTRFVKFIYTRIHVNDEICILKLEILVFLYIWSKSLAYRRVNGFVFFFFFSLIGKIV